MKDSSFRISNSDYISLGDGPRMDVELNFQGMSEAEYLALKNFVLTLGMTLP